MNRMKLVPTLLLAGALSALPTATLRSLSEIDLDERLRARITRRGLEMYVQHEKIQTQVHAQPANEILKMIPVKIGGGLE